MSVDLLDFDLLDLPVEEAPSIVEKPRAIDTHAAYVMKDGQAWSWQDLRDYVIREIEAQHGPQPRSLIKEKAIFESFLKRWGNKSADIARYAFEVENGRWMGAPIGVNRFCKASDIRFAKVIAERL